MKTADLLWRNQRQGRWKEVVTTSRPMFLYHILRPNMTKGPGNEVGELVLKTVTLQARQFVEQSLNIYSNFFLV